MDCEKFETALMDELYGELDELTSAAAKRHVSGCARCSALMGGLKATRRVAMLPRVDVPEGLEQRILAAAAAATPRVVPFRGRVARAVSLAGSWAMRPQTAMAAVFLVMIGTSVLLLRGKSSRAPASAQITVTEEGTPAPAASVAAAPAAEPLPASESMPSAVAERGADKPAGPTAGGPPRDLVASDDSRSRVAAKSARAEDLGAPLALNAPAHAAGGFASPPPPPFPSPVAAAPGAGGAAAPAAPPYAAAPAAEMDMESAKPATAPDPGEQLFAARSARDTAARQGRACTSGPQFDAVASRAPGTQAGWDALFEGALCYESSHEYGSARTRLGTLLGVPSYRDRARYVLDRINKEQQGGGAGAVAAARAAPAPTATPASPAKPASPAPTPASDGN